MEKLVSERPKKCQHPTTYHCVKSVKKHMLNKRSDGEDECNILPTNVEREIALYILYQIVISDVEIQIKSWNAAFK